MATRIGCDNLVYAVMTKEDTPTQAPTYGAVTAAPGVMSVNINPNASQETLFADDGPMETATTLGKIDVEIKKNELTAQNKADLLGHAIDANGGVIYSDSDVPPFVAIGFRTLKSNGKYRYVWLYKGRFTDSEDNNETKGDGINFQADTLKGQFVKLTHPVTAAGKQKRLWKYELDGDNEKASAPTMEAWFNEVTMPNEAGPSPEAASVSAAVMPLSASFAPGSVSGSTKATVVGEAGPGNHFAYTVAAEATQPMLGEKINGATTYVSGNNITGVEPGKVVTLFELTADNSVVKSYAHAVELKDIMA